MLGAERGLHAAADELLCARQGARVRCNAPLHVLCAEEDLYVADVKGDAAVSDGAIQGLGGLHV